MATNEMRQLDWDGCFNARDLGGLATTDGRSTRLGEIVRSDALAALTERGWEQLVAYGVRTVIDLRNDDERGQDATMRPSSVQTIHIPLDQTNDREFWDGRENGPQFGTPLYYAPHLRRFPSKSAEVLAAIAQAPSGGVAFHCAGGRDRAGQISILVLTLASVALDEIVSDYLLSYERLPAMYEARGEEDQTPLLKSFLSDRGTSAGAEIERFLQADVGALLAEGGLKEADVAALRNRPLPRDHDS
jgi:protein-tyrosine phosphatase